MGGVNGTWLNEHRLRPEEPTPLTVGSILRVGPYDMVLHGPDTPVDGEERGQGEVISAPITPGLAAVTATAGLSTPALAPVAEQPTLPPAPQSDAPLALYLARDTIAVEPGKQVDVKVDVENRADQEDRVTLRVRGIDSAWVNEPDEFVAIPPGQTVSVPFSIRPPRGQSIPTGRQRLRIELASQRYPEAKIGVSATLTVGEFIAFEADMEPKELRLPGRTTITIHNTGNAPSEFKVVGRDLQQVIRFRGEREGIQLQPNQVANIELALEPREMNWFGEGDEYPFDVEVIAAGGAKRTLPGEAIARSLIPTPWMYVLLFAVVFFCGLGSLALITNWDRLLGIGPTATPTPTLNFDQFGATQTSIAQFQTAVVATQSGAASQVAQTAVVEGDSDQDRLADVQETLSGTDPNNPDTDGDGLKDGDEVLIYTTDPRNRDSDGDILSDFDEITIYKTNPNMNDTDGDRITDGLEVAQGTDPLVPTLATATVAPPTITLPPATATWTPPPAATATATLVPPTATFTVVPPTATATLVPATATATLPPPLPGLACVLTPPVIDGVLNVGTEWPGEPLFSFQPTVVGAERIVRVYAVRDASRLYFGFLINDAANEASDSVRLYFDTTNNGGDPDTADRFFQVTRDGSRLLWAGVGNNLDGQEWNSNYTSTNWTAAVGEAGSGQWVVEMQIDAVAEMGALSDPFALMAQVLYTGDLATYPSTAATNQANTWQDFANILCQP